MNWALESIDYFLLDGFGITIKFAIPICYKINMNGIVLPCMKKK